MLVGLLTVDTHTQTPTRVLYFQNIKKINDLVWVSREYACIDNGDTRWWQASQRQTAGTMLPPFDFNLGEIGAERLWWRSWGKDCPSNATAYAGKILFAHISAIPSRRSYNGDRRHAQLTALVPHSWDCKKLFGNLTWIQYGRIRLRFRRPRVIR